MNGTVSGSSVTRYSAAEQGAGAVTDSCPHLSFSQPATAEPTEDSVEDDFTRHLLAEWKKGMYMEVQRNIVQLINELGANFWKTGEGSRWLGAEAEAPPTLDELDVQEPVLYGLEADGITQYELLAYKEGRLE